MMTTAVLLALLSCWRGVFVLASFHWGDWRQSNSHARSYPLSSGTLIFAVKDTGSQAIDTKDVWKIPRLYVGNDPSVVSCSCHELPLSSCLEHLVSRSNNKEPVTSILANGRLVQLSQDQSYYLSTVMRFNRAKDTPKVRLFDGKQEEWLAELQLEPTMGDRPSRYSNKQLTAKCVRRLRSCRKRDDDDASYCWIVVAAPKKKERNRWLVEKCTELNVAGMVFLETDFSETPERFKKLFSYAVEAAEQSERLDLPHFLSFMEQEQRGHDGKTKGRSIFTTKLSSMLKLWASDPRGVSFLVCRERATTTPSAVAVLSSLNKESGRHVACLIGPEGGWSKAEEEQFDELENKFPTMFYNVALGGTVLRTETAAMAVVAAHSMTFEP